MGKILILGHDDRVVQQGIVPDRGIFRIPKADLGNVLRVMTVRD